MKLDIVKNTEKAGYYGSMFGQDVEPKGTYVLEKPKKWEPIGIWAQGIADLNKVLYIDITEDTQISYKYDLAKEYKAKGGSLTKKLMSKGYDAIITRYPNGDSGEIILFPNARFMLHTNENFNMRIKKKNIILKEVANTNHEIERLKSRFSVFTPEDLSNADKVKILRNISLLNSLELNPRESYGVRLGDFQINPNSKYYFKIGDREYYRLNNELVKDSTGNEFWVIVRNNRITTFMLRKEVQSNSESYLKEKLRVDNVIFDLNSIMNENIIGESDDFVKSMIAFHGSPTEISNFSDEFVGGKDANDAVGPGVYFTTSKEDASSYGTNIYQVILDTSKYLTSDPIKKDYSKQLIKLIKMSSDWRDNAQNYDENPERGVMNAVKGYHQYDDNVKDLFLSVWVDFYRYDAINFVRNMVAIGYDGIVIDGYNRNKNFKHLIVYNLNTIEVVKDRKVKENIDEELIDEDFNSQKYMGKLATDILKAHIHDYIVKILANAGREPSNVTSRPLAQVDGDYGVLNKFVHKFYLAFKFEDLGNASGVFFPFDGKGGMIKLNIDSNVIYRGFIAKRELGASIPLTEELIFHGITNGNLLTVLTHELQHAYDNFISNGKFISDKASKKYYANQNKINPSNQTDDQYTTYVKLPHEINARFTQTIDDISLLDKKKNFISLKIYLDELRKNFYAWDKINPNDKKKLYRRASQYYYKFKDIYDEEKKRRDD